MKRLLIILALGIILSPPSLAQDEVNFGVFYSSLSPYGEWISLDGGSYAWRPTGVESGWRPYFVGNWAWTDDGWCWVSEEPWAWATYHYGRWYSDDFYGWVWIPGYEWAPAWVEWRYGDACVGWAPLGPYAVYSAGWGIHYRRYWATPSFYWSFVDCRYVSTPYINRYVYRNEENVRYIGRTRSGGSVRYEGGRIIARGPEREFVERKGNIRVERADLVDVHERGQAGVFREGGSERVAVYRPRVSENNRDGAIRPERVRGNDRPVALDTKGTDVRRADTEGGVQRDYRRAEEYRQPVQVERSPNRTNQIDASRPQITPTHPTPAVTRPSSNRPAPVYRPTYAPRPPRNGASVSPPPQQRPSPRVQTARPPTETPKAETPRGGDRRTR